MTPSVAGQRGLLWYRTYGTAVGTEAHKAGSRG